MLFTVPFGLLIMCFALLFGLSAVGDDSDIIGGESRRFGGRRRRSRRQDSRRGDIRWGRNNRRDDFDGNQPSDHTSDQRSAAEYLGYDAADSITELTGESYEETARRLEAEAELHLQQIMGDGT